MTTAFKPFTTANAVSSIDLLRPTGQPPSPEETLDVTIAAWTQAQQVEITPTPHGTTEAEHFLHSRRTALQQAAEDVYMTAFENATPETGTPSSRRSTKTASPSPGGPTTRPHPPSPRSTAPHSAVSTTPSSGSPSSPRPPSGGSPR